MKKIIILVLLVFILSGCQHQSSTVDKQFELYDRIKLQLEENRTFDDEYKFHIRMVTQHINDSYRYDIIIDQPQETMYDVIALAYANENNQTMCPNVGIFDDDSMNLKKDFIDKQNGFYKGIQLSGKTSHLQSVKVYVSYYADEMKTKRVEKYIEVSEK